MYFLVIPCGPVARTARLHCHGLGSIPVQGTKIPQAPQRNQKFFKKCISLKLIFSCSLNFSTHFRLTQSKNSINSSSYYCYPITLSEDKPVFCTVHSSPLLKSLQSLRRKVLPLTPFTPLKLSLKTPTSFQL